MSSVLVASGRRLYLSKSKNTSLSASTARNSLGSGGVPDGAETAGGAGATGVGAGGEGSGAAGGLGGGAATGGGAVGGGTAGVVVAGRFGQPARKRARAMRGRTESTLLG